MAVHTLYDFEKGFFSSFSSKDYSKALPVKKTPVFKSVTYFYIVLQLFLIYGLHMGERDGRSDT